jgi:hypothetical protein
MENTTCNRCDDKLADIEDVDLHNASHDYMEAETIARKLKTYELQYGKLTPAYRRSLIKVLGRDTVEQRNSGLTVLALKAFPSSPKQKFIQSLRD